LIGNDDNENANETQVATYSHAGSQIQSLELSQTPFQLWVGVLTQLSGNTLHRSSLE